MKLIGTMVVHNEDWIIGLTARAMLMWCDELIVLDHCSTDNTRGVLMDIALENEDGRLTIVIESDPVFHSIRFYELVVNIAISRGATHVAVLDADEILSANMIQYVREQIEALQPGFYLDVPWIPMATLTARLISRLPSMTGFVFNVSGGVEYPHRSSGEYDLHLSRLPLGFKPVLYNGDGGLMHLQSIDQRRAKAKAVRWKFTEILRWPHRVSTDWLNDYYDAPLIRPDDVAKQVDAWWYSLYHDWYVKHVVIGGESAAEQEVKELWAHKDKFAGVNTFGLFD